MHRKKVQVARYVISQPIRLKIDFTSMRQVAKSANKSDLPMVLCMLRPIELPKDKRGKSKVEVGSPKSLTEGEKCWMMKETGPMKIAVLIKEVIHKKVQEANPTI